MTTKVTRFTVSGSLPFPVDMLRYDACWPGSSSDAGRLAESIDSRMRKARELPGKAKYRWSVSMVTHQPSGPTVGRWRSFGWEVDEVEPSFNL